MIPLWCEQNRPQRMWTVQRSENRCAKVVWLEPWVG